MQEILNNLLERMVEVLPVTAAGVTLISAGAAPRYIAASDEAAMRFERLQSEIGHGPVLSAYRSGVAVAVPDLRTDDRFPRFGSAAVAAGLAAVFTFPLRHGDGRLGALDLYRDTPGPLEPHVIGIAQALADVAAAYLLSAQAREEARATSERFHHNALHDPLTGLPNRLLLQERLEHAAQRAKRSHTSAAILFTDLDHFKDVNDSHGHHVGDELLLAVAQRLSRVVRSGDTLARFSGDEFVFLCEDLCSPADVEILARRIDEAFATPFVLTCTEVSVTASVGVAYAGPGEDISNRLVEQADTAMYRAKRKGGAGHQIIDLREAVQATTPTARPATYAARSEDGRDVDRPIVHSAQAQGDETGVPQQSGARTPALTTATVDARRSRVSRSARPARGRGRPRDQRVEAAVADAVTELLAEAGYEALTIEGVAARAKVAKTTLYRRWSTKAQLVTHVVEMRTQGVKVAADTGSFRRDLLAQLQAVAEAFSTPIGHATISLAVARRGDPELTKALCEDSIAIGRAELADVLNRAKTRGELTCSADPTAAIDLMISTLWYRAVVWGESLTPDHLPALVDILVPGFTNAAHD